MNIAAFGRQLREARKRLGITQAELGKRCGLSGVMVNYIENGKKNSSFKTLAAFERVLGVKIELTVERN